MLEKIHIFNLRGVTLLEGRFQRQFEDMKAYFMSLPNDDLLYGFRQRAGLPAPGVELGGWYNNDVTFDPDCDEIFNTFGQWLSAYARIWAVTGDQTVRQKAALLLQEWEKTIEEDGYFFYSRRCNAHHYVFDKIVCGLVDLAAYAGLDSALGCLSRITDWAINNLAQTRLPATPQYYSGADPAIALRDSEWYSLSENLYRAYLLTGDEKYRDFASVWHYTNYWDALRAGQAGAMIGLHGYSHVNTLSSAAMAYLVTSEEKYLQVIVRGYELFKKYQWMASGGYAPDEQLASPDGSNGEKLLSSSDTFEVPCGSWAVSKLTRYLLTLTGEARFGEWLELILYNAIGAALPMKDDRMRRGKTFYYADYRLNGGRKRYYPASYPCCSGTYPQMVTDYHDIIYFWDAQSFYVNLFMPSRVEQTYGGIAVCLQQETSYPESDTTKLTISSEAKARFSLKIRIPSWAKADEVEIRVNEEVQKLPTQPDTWTSLDRTWSNGDVVSISVPMSLRFVPIDRAHPRRVALMYGPVMLARLGLDGKLRGDIDNPADWIRPESNTPLHFKVDNADNSDGEFVPFYEIPEQVWYRVYHDLE